MSEKLYAEYQGSAAAWVGQMPAHWQSIRAKWLFSQQRRPRQHDDEQLSATQKFGVVPQKAFMEQEGKRLVLALSGTDNFLHVDKDDFVISLRSFQGGIERCHYSGCVTPAYTVLKCEASMNHDFLGYLLKSSCFVSGLQIATTGIREGKNISFDEFGSMLLPVPSISEQKEIACYLDQETGRIDALISMKSQFIAWLHERAVASVIEAVAPRSTWASVPFWSISTIKSICGLSDEGLLSVYLDRGVIPYAEGGGLVHKPAESLEKYQLVEPGDFVMNNQQAWRGSVGVSTHRGIVSPAYLVLGLDREKIDPAFANYAFRSRTYVDQFMLASMSVGDIQRQIKWHLLRRIPVSLPPVEEQRDIAARLDREKARIDLLIAKTERSIELLKEHRSALITAAVTGKIDVRGLAAKNMKAAA